MTRSSVESNHLLDAHFLHSNVRIPRLKNLGGVALERGEGIYVYDTQGKRYMEAISGAWHIAFGFSEQRLIDTVSKQMSELPAYHAFFGRVAESTLRLAERLVDIAPMPTGKVFFSNSGSEANESAIKILWLINWYRGQPKKRKIISRKSAYHGSTVLTASLAGSDYIHPYGLPVSEVSYTPMPHYWRHATAHESEEDYAGRLAQELDDLIVAHGPQTVAGFIADPILSAGGVIPPPRTYFQKVEAVLRKHEVAIIADEVVTGLGRTGELWGSTTFGLKPDIVTTSKVLSAGYYPIGATLIGRSLSQDLEAACRESGEFSHGFTTGGSPVGAAVGMRVIELLLEDGIFDHLRDMSVLFADRLGELSNKWFVGEVRQAGLMAGISLVSDRIAKTPFAPELDAAGQIEDIALSHGLIVRSMHDSIVLAPPFIVSSDEIDSLFETLNGVLDVFEARVLP